MKALWVGVIIYSFLRLNCFACQECMIVKLNNESLRIVSKERSYPAERAEVRIYQAVKIGKGKVPRQELSCLSYFEIGKRIWTGKTDKNGMTNLTGIPPGQYWIAIRKKIKGSVEHGVYMVVISAELKNQDIADDFYVSDIGMVQHKCGVKPIEYFFH
jgi:hypothetical protein